MCVAFDNANTWNTYFWQILYAKDVDQRSTTFEKSLQIGKYYQRRTRMLILRAAMLKNQIQVRVSFYYTQVRLT